MSRKTYYSLIWVAATVYMLSNSSILMGIISPENKITMSSETYRIENEIWINGGDIYSGEEIVYEIPLTLTILYPNGEVYRIDRTRSKSLEERNSIACVVACGPGFEYLLLEVTDETQRGEWMVTVSFEGDGVYRSAENTHNFWVE